jgi:hypothetical protein
MVGRQRLHEHWRLGYIRLGAGQAKGGRIMLSGRPVKGLIATAIFVILMAVLPATAPATDHGAFPSPDYGPEDVVRIQVQALANNDTPYRNAGIEVAFRFASPANKRFTGPLRRFIRMLYTPTYRPFLLHRTAHVGQADIQGSQATLTVILTTADGRRVGFVFRLSRQRGGPCDTCWMTDEVWPIDLQEANSPLRNKPKGTSLPG